ncbi:hypothetical protein, partial [Methylomonas koyamae]|uniref:hypothetical protein n=1 Tax=Methylomonas koyamae TaxID=702114 RepID=UPI00211083AF
PPPAAGGNRFRAEPFVRPATFSRHRQLACRHIAQPSSGMLTCRPLFEISKNFKYFSAKTRILRIYDLSLQLS